MNAETLSSVAGMLLSLGMSYIPGLSGWYAKLGPEAKRLTMAGLLVLAAGVSALWACTGGARVLSHCVVSTDLRTYGQAIIAALVANQAMFMLTPDKADKKKPRRRRAKKAAAG
jgi:hypothetical protein